MTGMRTTPTFPKHFKRAISEHKGNVKCEGYDYENFSDENKEAPLSEPSFTTTMKMLRTPEGFNFL